jgi:hypothetical protein
MSDNKDPADASWLRLLLVGTAALVCAGLVIAALLIGVVALLD